MGFDESIMVHNVWEKSWQFYSSMVTHLYSQVQKQHNKKVRGWLQNNQKEVLSPPPPFPTNSYHRVLCKFINVSQHLEMFSKKDPIGK